MSIARILFQIPLPEPFDYDIPEGMDIEVGSVVEAPIGKIQRIGVVWDIIDENDGRDLKTVTDVFPTPPFNKSLIDFVDWSAKYVCAAPGSILSMIIRSPAALRPSSLTTILTRNRQATFKDTEARRQVIEAIEEIGPSTLTNLAKRANVSSSVVKGLELVGALLPKEYVVDVPYPPPNITGKNPQLTDEQAAASLELRDSIKSGGFHVSLIDGVTGSGKTEVYFEAIDEALAAHPEGQVLVLLPEIALTQAIITRFAERFGEAPVQWHSGLTQKERRRAWREIAHGRARMIVGARSALFLPYPALKLTIIDEEHDSSFKQEEGVIYHARDLAIARARFETAQVILASATPALETLTNAAKGRFLHLKLAARPGAARMPDVDLIDLREHELDKDQSLSEPLRSALTETLENGEQSLLFLNRRGYAPLVLCKACGEKLKTPGTESWLTEHRYSGRLICHLTGYSMRKPNVCPECGAQDSLTGVGPGIERLAGEVRELFPKARIDLFSSDTVVSPEDVRDKVGRMERSETDILIGTQMVAKGHNFPNLTFVGVIDADSGLKGGDLRAGERTFQLLSQVAGRAGRAEKPGRALLQTWQSEAPLMQALADSDRDAFLTAERDAREALGFPPFGRLAAMILSFPEEAEAAKLARDIAATAPHADRIDIWGPAPAPISVLRGRWRWRYLVRSDRDIDLSAFMSAWKDAIKLPSRARIQIDIDPYSFM